MPRKTLEETIGEVFEKKMAERDQRDKEDKDPWAKLEGMIDRAVDRVFERRLGEGRTSGDEGGDEGGDGGILDFLVKRG